MANLLLFVDLALPLSILVPRSILFPWLALGRPLLSLWQAVATDPKPYRELPKPYRELNKLQLQLKIEWQWMPSPAAMSIHLSL